MYIGNNNVNNPWQSPLSPDLDPIEHLWDELGHLVRQRPVKPTNLRELVEEWNRIPQNRLVQLAESIPHHLVDVITACGSHLRY